MELQTTNNHGPLPMIAPVSSPDRTSVKVIESTISQILENGVSCASEGNLGVVEASNQLPLIPLFFTVAQASTLAGVSQRAIRMSIVKKTLDFTCVVVDSGKYNGREKYMVASESLFTVYPTAKISWETQNQQIINQTQEHEATQEAQKKDSEELAKLKDWERAVAYGRLRVLQEVNRREVELLGEAPAKGAKTGQRERAIRQLVLDSEGGKLSPELQDTIRQANARRGSKKGSRTVSRASIIRWGKQLKAHGAAGLAPKVKEWREPNFAKDLLHLYSFAWDGQPIRYRGMPRGCKNGS